MAVALYVIGAALCIGLAVVLNRLVERPAMRLSARFKRPHHLTSTVALRWARSPPSSVTVIRDPTAHRPGPRVGPGRRPSRSLAVR